jgi:hypothetical protein
VTSTVVEQREGERLVLRDTFVPNEKQAEFFDACAEPYDRVQEVLFEGSIRAGKTAAACKLLIGWAMRTGGTYVVSRFSYRELEDSTKKMFLYGDGGMPPAIPRQLLRGGTLDKAKNETHNKVTLVNGAEILFRALEPKERGKIRNITACGWFIDQAEELDGEDIDDFYQEIKGRCSDPRGPRKLILVANPGPTDHLLYTRFLDPVTRHPKTRNVHVTILDNRKYLPEDYVQMLLDTEHTNPDYFKRMVMGEWGAIGGKRVRWWNRSVHVVPAFDIPDGWEILEGQDAGWDHPHVCMWVAIDFTGRKWVVAEYTARETPIPRIAAKIKEIRRPCYRGNGDAPPGERPFYGDLTPSASWLDPSAWNKTGAHESVAAQLLEHEIYVSRANNERLGGWSRLDTWGTTTMDDGRPMLQVFENCEGLIKEFPNAKVKAGTDDIEKVRDDHLDPLRYVALSRTPSPEEQVKEEEGTREAAFGSMVKRRSGEPEERSLWSG